MADSDDMAIEKILKHFSGVRGCSIQQCHGAEIVLLLLNRINDSCPPIHGELRAQVTIPIDLNDLIGQVAIVPCLAGF